MKQIEEFPNYFITKTGRVFNASGAEIKRQVNTDGYWVVNLYSNQKDTKSSHRRCARMVGLTYLLDTYSPGLLINHKNLDITNDSVDNLEWVTPKRNCQHSLELQPHVHRKPSEYSEAFIRKICGRIEAGHRNVDILREEPISRDVLLHIRCGQSWVWVSKDFKLTPSNRGISEATAKWVCYKIKDGYNNRQISELHNSLNMNIVKNIRNGRTWKKVSKDILG